MADFSANDINEAKRRVLEMQNKASHFVDNNRDNHTENNIPESFKNQDDLPENNDIKQDKSFFVILALIMLLSQEKADNTLILALLYLLL